MLEAEIIAHCAPTLAGIKTANMFTYTPMNRNKLSMEIEEENRKLNCRGVFVEVLRTSEHKALVYVYREGLLQKELENPENAAFLKSYGYENTDIAYALIRLNTGVSVWIDCFPQ